MDMNRPENEPTGGLRPYEGGELTPPKGFSVRVENPDLIFKAIQNGVSGEIGKHLLESPVEEVKAEIKSGKDSFNILGEVSIDLRATLGLEKRVKQISPEDVINTIAQGYVGNNPDGKIIERARNLVITAPRGTRLVLSVGRMDRDIKISTGLVEPRYSVGEEPIQLVSAPLSTQEGFEASMEDFIDVMKVAVQEMYKSVRKVSPDEELVLRPPKIGLSGGKDRNLGGIFGNIETPADLAGKIEIEKPDVKFADIGGQSEAKREIQGLAFALKNPDLYQKWGTKSPKGIILYGPPGTGKTLMAKALASQAEARFLHVEASDIASKWYGESEKIVKSIFDLAASYGEPTIIFFDEVDAVAPQREGAHQATQRTVSTLLENMDGMVANPNVMVVASTNRLESVDSALLRAGRFDRWVEVPLPDEQGRRQILDIHMRKAEEIAGRTLFHQISVDTVVSSMERTSGADIAEIIRRVLEDKVRQEGMGQEASEVSTEDILREIKGYEKVRETKRRLGFPTSQVSSNRLQIEEPSSDS